MRSPLFQPRLGALLAALALLVAAPGFVGGAGAETDGTDPLHTRVRSELSEFTTWLSDEGVEGFIGEVGWPDGADADDWNALAEAWYTDADDAGLWVTAWATGEWWPTDYPLLVYEDRFGSEGVDTPSAQARVVEAHLSTAGYLRGVNVAGAEFAAPNVQTTSSFSNENPGTYDVDYHYDSQATFDYLAGRGVELVRLPFRWERIQPQPGGALDEAELQRLTDAVSRARSAGLRVVLDMHNYGAYYLFDGTQGVRRPIGSSQVSVADFADVWQRLSRVFRGDDGVAGYGLMNEPVGLDDDVDWGTTEGAALWERASQAALDAVRGNGDGTLVLVPGYFWSGVQNWTHFHPDAWIADPAGNHRYEAHHYWDSDNSGQYRRSYDEEVELAAEDYPSGCTITGTEGPDELMGTSGDDVICGLGGGDRIRGGDGDDVLRGGPGDDHLLGGPGADRLAGGGGDDTLAGHAGNDPLLHGGPGDDLVYGGPGADELVGGSGADRLGGGGADDVIRGGPGPDRLMASEGADRLAGNAGDDVVAGHSGDDARLHGGFGDDRVYGGTGADALVGGPGADVLIGNEGIDRCLTDPSDRYVASCER